MKIQLLDAHDRLLHLKKTQTLDIGACCDDLIKQRPFGDHPFYIFNHARTEDNGVDKRLVWQPRLMRPKAQYNTMLFKAYPGKDQILPCWIIPPPELWDEYKMGNLMEHSFILICIDAYVNNRRALEAPEPDDPSPERCQEITFEYQPLLFKRETLSPDKQASWDRAKRIKDGKASRILTTEEK